MNEDRKRAYVLVKSRSICAEPDLLGNFLVVVEPIIKKGKGKGGERKGKERGKEGERKRKRREGIEKRRVRFKQMPKRDRL